MRVKLGSNVDIDFGAGVKDVICQSHDHRHKIIEDDKITQFGVKFFFYKIILIAN